MNLHHKLWAGAILTFGVGDLATTYIGIQTEGVREFNQSAHLFMSYGGFEMLILAKLAAMLIILGLSRFRYDCMRWIAPLTLTLMGVSITAWNTGVILVAL